MFVLGLGNIFLNGFKSKNVGFREHGHRMGYLTDEEYNFLSGEAIRLRTTGELQFQTETELRGRLLNRLSGNKQMLERYLAHARQRFQRGQNRSVFRRCSTISTVEGSSTG
jgi:hypothetical protein